MNEVCRGSFKLIQELLKQNRQELDSALVRSMQETQFTGMEGEPLPYRLNDDWIITCLMFLCFFLLYYALNRKRKYLYQHLKRFFTHKKRSNLFDDPIEPSLLSSFTLTGTACILGGICLYDYFLETNPLLLAFTSHHLLLAIYILSIIALIIGKWGLYRFTNEIFFDKEQNDSWTTSYFDLIIATGFLLFPTILLIVFFNLSFFLAQTLVLATLLITKLLLFYKCIRNFFNHFHGILHLILYFCTLEIVPDLLLWKGIIYVNKIVI